MEAIIGVRLSDARIILICGGRDYRSYRRVTQVLNLFPNLRCIVHGDARGADRLARQWAELSSVEHKSYPADWDKLALGAGPARNQQMLNENPDIDLVIAFPGGNGTLDMCTRAAAQGIEVKSIDWDWKAK